jgi:DGQHR domain-containing protein
MSDVSKLLGMSKAIFTPAVVGQSLNVWVLRGSAGLDELAAIAFADIANDITNPNAPQRLANPGHAREALDYALAMSEDVSDSVVRFFPEVILNVRETSVLKVFTDSGEEVEFDSIDGIKSDSRVVKLEIDLEKIDRNLTKPQISTVDGNHRLIRAFEMKLDNPELEFPSVSYAILVGLSEKQETILFRDVNGQHKGMNTSHLAAISYTVEPLHVLLQRTVGQANWLAHRMCDEGQPFYRMVSSYSDKSIYKKENLAVPPITLQGLKTAIQRTITKSEQLKQSLDPNNASPEKLPQMAEAAAVGLSLYWSAVKNNFPEAWQDKKNFILLQSIGLNAFSMLGAEIIDRAVTQGKMAFEDFNLILKHISTNVDLQKSNYEGVAGAAGGDKVYKELFAALSKDMDKTTMLEAWGTHPKSALED